MDEVTPDPTVAPPIEDEHPLAILAEVEGAHSVTSKERADCGERLRRPRAHEDTLWNDNVTDLLLLGVRGSGADCEQHQHQKHRSPSGSSKRNQGRESCHWLVYPSISKALLPTGTLSMNKRADHGPGVNTTSLARKASARQRRISLLGADHVEVCTTRLL